MTSELRSSNPRRRQHPADLRDLRRWLITDLCRYYGLDDLIEEHGVADGEYHGTLRTASNIFDLYATEPSGDDRGLLKCVVTALATRSTRVLYGGPLCDDCWDGLVRAMLAWELGSTLGVEPVEKTPAQVPFCTPEMIAAMGSRPKSKASRKT